jgi:hypothetical protein
LNAGLRAFKNNRRCKCPFSLVKKCDHHAVSHLSDANKLAALRALRTAEDSDVPPTVAAAVADAGAINSILVQIASLTQELHALDVYQVHEDVKCVRFLFTVKSGVLKAVLFCPAGTDPGSLAFLRSRSPLHTLIRKGAVDETKPDKAQQHLRALVRVHADFIVQDETGLSSTKQLVKRFAKEEGGEGPIPGVVVLKRRETPAEATSTE